MAKRGAVTDFLNSFNSAYGMTKKVAQDWELGRAAQMQPTEIEQGYTSADGEQLRNIANARDAEGNPYYNVTAGQDGGYQVNSNFQLDGQTPAPAGMAPRQVTQFNGSNYAGSMDDAQVRGLRQRAMADVYAKYDPIKGMEMQQRLDQGDRDTKRFGWEEAAQPLKQRTAELQLKGYERADTKEENALKLQEEERALTDSLRAAYANKDKDPQALEQWQKLVSPYVNAMHTFNGDQNNYGIAKDGSIIGIPKSGGSAFTVDPMAALPMVLQINRLSSKFGGDPMAAAKALNDMTDAERKKFLEADDRAYNRATSNAKLVGDKEQRDNTSRYQMGSLGVQRDGLKLRQNEAARPDLMQMYDAKGNVVLVDKRSLKAGVDGTVSLPTGLRMPKLPQELTERQKIQLTAYNKALEGLPTDVPRAQLDALAARYGVADIIGGVGGLSWGDAPVPKVAPTPVAQPAQGLRQPQITTLTAPRSGAEARGMPMPQLSDEEIFIRAMGGR